MLILDRIEQADASHIDAIVALIESAYRGESGLAGWTTETHLIDGQRTDHDEIRTLLHTPKHLFFIGWKDDRIVTCCLLEQREHGCYFGMFAVSPTCQGRGIGKALMQHAEEHARTVWHAEHMVMSVIKQRSDLIAWYERLGYTRTGDTMPFPYGDPRAGLPKRDDLVFLVLKKPLASMR